MTEHDDSRDSSPARRRALITGSAAGLGLAFGHRLAAAGFDILLHGLEPEREVAVRCGEISQAHGVDARYLHADLASEAAIAHLIRTLIDDFGGVDVLVNNAVVRHFSPVDAFSMEAWNTAIAVNLTAPFMLIRGLLPGMKSRNWGRIVNVSSIYGTRGAVNRADYVTTKTALLGLTRAVAMEIAPLRITCNALCPGTVMTQAIADRVAELARERNLDLEAAQAAFLEGKQPSGRFIPEGNVADYLAFICSEAAGDINGATLGMDGGWSAAP